MKRRLIGGLFALAAACGWLSGCEQQKATETTTEASSGAPVVQSDSLVTIRIHSLENYSSQEREYAFQAAQKLEEVVNSQEFHTKLLNARFLDPVKPADVYAAIMLAHEQAAPYKDSCADHTMDFWLRLDSDGLNCNGSSIGGDGDSTGYVNSCPNRIRCWAATGCIASMAGHMMHEYMHHLGYKHPLPFKTKKSPYVVGNLVQQILTNPQGQYKLKYCADWPNSTSPCAH